MKRNLSLWMGLLALALTPALAQTPAATGKIHGHVTNPAGTPVLKCRTDGGGRYANRDRPIFATVVCS